jgi:tetratricopeptide (TPR) repeat protein
MIGRGAEMARLLADVDELLEQRRGRFVYLRGEAGLGKSRLIAEMRSRLADSPVRYLEGHSLTYRRGAAYWMFAEVLRSLLGVSPYTPAAQVRQRLQECLANAGEQLSREVLPALEHLLALAPGGRPAPARWQALDAGQRREETFLAMRELLAAECRRQPTVLVLEDMHWADDVSLDLLAALFDVVTTWPLLIIGSSRPRPEGALARLLERAEARLGERFTVLDIKSLSAAQSEQLLTELLTAEALPAELREQVLQRAAGVPFYLEEILRMLMDAGLLRRQGGGWQTAPQTDVGALGVPATLQELILARFDRLSERERRVLQFASVIGRQFSYELLEAVMASARVGTGTLASAPAGADPLANVLQGLVRREFVLPLPHATGEVYQFRHALVAEAIYSTLLRRDRGELHGLVGEAMERVYAGGLEEHIEVLARHYAWSTRLDRALHYLILAGQKAARGNAIEQARNHFEQARALLRQAAHAPVQAAAVHTGLGDIRFFFGDYEAARASYHEALAALPAADAAMDPHDLARERSALHRKHGRTFERQGQYEEALESLVAARRALDGPGLAAPAEKASLLQDIGWIHFRRGNFELGQQYLQEALSLVEGTDAYEVVASIYNRLGGLAYSQGDWAQCASYVRKSIAIREAIGDLITLADSFNNLGVLEIEMGQFDSALENLARCHDLKRRQGQADGIAIALNNLGLLRVRRGELEEANAALGQALAIAGEIGYSSLLGSIHLHYAELYLASGEWAAARQSLTQSSEIFSELGVTDQLAESYRLLADLALAVDDLPAAQRWAEQAEGLARPKDGQPARLSAIQHGEHLRLLGRLAGCQGDWAGAHRLLKECEAVFAERGNRLYQGRVAYDFGVLARRQGDGQRAQLHFREASLLFRSVGARLEARRATEALASEP